MKNVRYLFIAFMLIISISLVYAEIDVNTYTVSDDFTVVSGNQNLNYCTCSPSVDSIIIKNTGTFGAIFTITPSGLDNVARISENYFQLESGQTKTVYIYVDSQCKALRGDFKVTVSSNLGPVKSFVKNYNIEKCQNVELWIKDPVQNINPCSDARFTLFVKNIGGFEETYTVSSNDDTNVAYSSSKFTLKPNQVAQISADKKFDCSIYGINNITFYAKSEYNGLQAKISGNINIAKDYDFSVKINNDASDEKTLDVCNRLYWTEYPITVKNNGVKNTFILDTKLPSFARFDGIPADNKFMLEAGESKTFKIIIDTHTFRSESKSTDIVLNFKTAYGDESITKKITIANKPCYEFSLNVLPDNTKNTAAKVCTGEIYPYDINIVNNGVFKENVKINVEGAPEETELSDDTITLDPAESKTLKMFIAPSEGNIYNIKVSAMLNNEIAEYDNVWLKS